MDYYVLRITFEAFLIQLLDILSLSPGTNINDTGKIFIILFIFCFVIYSLFFQYLLFLSTKVLISNTNALCIHLIFDLFFFFFTPNYYLVRPFSRTKRKRKTSNVILRIKKKGKREKVGNIHNTIRI